MKYFPARQKYINMMARGQDNIAPAIWRENLATMALVKQIDSHANYPLVHISVLADRIIVRHPAISFHALCIRLLAVLDSLPV